MDKTELVFIDVESKKAQVHNFTYEHMIRIQLSSRKEFALFRLVQADTIELYTRRRPEPFVISRRKNKEHFDSYVASLEKFAKRNNLTFAHAARA